MRPYTNPRREAQKKKKKKGGNNGEAFDPDELCRQLEKYRQEEKEARMRRRAQASDKKGVPGQYHHVPQCAAASFARTATPESRKKKDIHRLARQVLQTQQAAVDSKGLLAAHGPSIRRIVEGQDMARLKLEETADRNQFQCTPALEEAARADHERNLNKPPQRDFEVSLSEDLPSNLRRARGGDISDWDPSKIETNGTSRHVAGVPNPNDRHDWAQRDDTVETDKQGLRDRMTPFSEVVRRFGGGKGRDSPKPAVEALGDDSLDDSGGKRASLRKPSFLSLPLFRKVSR